MISSCTGCYIANKNYRKYLDHPTEVDWGSCDLSCMSVFCGVTISWYFMIVYLVDTTLVICPQFWQNNFVHLWKKEPEHHHFFGIFYTPFWNATKHERFREAATFLCSKRQLSVTNFGNQSGRQSWEIKSCFNLRSCNQVEMPKQKVVDLGNLRINNINITVFSIFHFLFWSMLKYETIMNYHGKSIQLFIVFHCHPRCIWPATASLLGGLHGVAMPPSYTSPWKRGRFMTSPRFQHRPKWNVRWCHVDSHTPPSENMKWQWKTHHFQ